MAVLLTASTTVEDLLRLAWEAENDGKPGLRDALLTLLVAESGPDDAVLSERCRKTLVARQPNHWYANGATLGQILAHERVAGAIAKLRAIFPPVRVQRMLLRAEAQRGAFDGARAPLERVLRDLHLIPGMPPIPVPRAAPRVAVASAERHAQREPVRALPFPTASGFPSSEADASITAFYLSVLLAMAVLLQEIVDRQGETRPDRDARAA